MDVDEFLEHHGVKGQKWGVRKDAGHVGETARTKKIAKLDKRFEKTVASTNAGRPTMEFHNALVERINSRVRDLNDSQKYRNADLNKPGKLKNDYEKDGHELFMRAIEDSTRENYGSNASGTKKAVYNRKTDMLEIVDIAASHADNNARLPDFAIKFVRNATGHIVDFKIVDIPNTIEQTAMSVGNFLAHYGTKGMKWGVRTDGSVTSTTTKNSHLRRGEQNVTVKQRPGTFVKTSGGKRQTASSDAVKTAAARQVAKKSTTDALSTKQLEDAVKRMQVEQKFDKLAKQTDRRDRGRRFIESITGNKNVQAGSKHVAKKAAVMAAKAAAAA